MKSCELCGEQISTKDGVNRCSSCEEKTKISPKRKALKREREQTLRGCGLVKVRGSMGGVYWE